MHLSGGGLTTTADTNSDRIVTATVSVQLKLLLLLILLFILREEKVLLDEFCETMMTQRTCQSQRTLQM